ncbi:MAG TPA: hypothetical protein VHX88_05265 [Solirubrobacteraceae bacterium]|jgi:hypothetical protein|nr:hypothetical protein [Solirubrobacteraceae bacterium]
MYVLVDLESAPSAAPVLHEPDEFRSLKVVVRGEKGSLAEAIAPVGWLDPGGDAFLSVDALRRLAGPRVRDASWNASFEAMLEYARSKGWVDPSGGALQAHCEPA